jgi:hypothetical protein
MPDDMAGRLDIRAARLRRLYRDWDSWRHGRAFPSRADFDPLNLKYILGNLTLFDVLRDPLRFVFRLHATNNVDRLGADMTGKELAQMTDVELRDGMRADYERVVVTGAPAVRRGGGSFGKGRGWDYEVLVLPLAADGETIDMLMAAMDWNER